MRLSRRYLEAREAVEQAEDSSRRTAAGGWLPCLTTGESCSLGDLSTLVQSRRPPA